jgi:teichuronic acid biosynthesis glycosyltransferase TuaG
MTSKGELPFVSVVMPAYNASKYISAAIESVLSQAYQDFELIVIDDCSEDDTYLIAKSYAEKDPRIILLKNAENSGVSATRNYGISKARGEWIAFLDSDDMWRSDKLEKQLVLLQEHPDAKITYTASAFIDSEGTPYNYVMPAEQKMTYRMLLKKNLLSCSSVMVRRDVISRVKMADDKMHEDYSAWLRILRETPFAYGVNEPLLIYRLSKNSKSSGRIKSAKMIYNSYRYVGYNIVVSLFLMLQYSVHSISKHSHIKNNQ